jgi:hypothetical protein
VLVVTSDGRHDFIGRPLGTDFAQVWVAGTEVLGGHPAQPFDVQAHLGAQRVFFGPAIDVYGWHYPPYFLALGALLALLPYGAALAVCVAKLSYIPLGPIVMLTLFALIIGRAMQARSDITRGKYFPRGDSIQLKNHLRRCNLYTDRAFYGRGWTRPSLGNRL